MGGVRIAILRRRRAGYALDGIMRPHAEMPSFATSYEDLMQRCPLL